MPKTGTWHLPNYRCHADIGLIFAAAVFFGQTAEKAAQELKEFAKLFVT
jgi:hypothetical protein